MRQTVRRFLPLFLAVGAIVAAVAFPAVALSATCRTADSCKSLEHDSTANAAKTINVDAAGTVLVGGSGSRVELLASGTDTTVSATSTLIFTTYASAAQSVSALPAWCHSIQFEYRITSMSGGAPANFQIGFSGADPSGNALLVDGWISSTTVAAPALGGGAGNVTVAGKIVTGVALGNISVTGTGTITYSPILPRNFKLTRFFSSAPTTTLVAPWRLYCIGG
jgi:hypothetical protein